MLARAGPCTCHGEVQYNFETDFRTMYVGECVRRGRAGGGHRAGGEPPPTPAQSADFVTLLRLMLCFGEGGSVLSCVGDSLGGAFADFEVDFVSVPVTVLVELH